MSNVHAAHQRTKNLAGGWRSIAGPWMQENVPVSQAGVALKRAAAANTGTEFVPVNPGSVVGIGASFTVAPAGSTLTLTVTKNGTPISGCVLSVAPGAALGRSVTFAVGVHTFVASDRLAVTVTTDGAWSAITSDLLVDIEIESTRP